MGRTARVSSSDVARAAGVSRTTVSYVLNGVGQNNIPVATRERVLQTAKQLGYRVNSLAKGLKSGRAALIGVFCKVREDGFHSRMLHGIHEVCYDEGYNVLIAYLGATKQIEDENLQRMLDYNVTGIARIVSDDLTEAEVVRLMEMQANNDTPCVLIDDHAHGELFDSVASDDFSGAMLATNHLINLGHTRIGYVNLGKIANKGRQVRQQGFVASMTAAGFPTDDVLVSEKFDDEQGRAVRTFLDRSDRPTALFCTNDEIAAVAREAARELGIRVPEDLAIAGYGNGILATYGGFTSVQEQAEAMGRAAVRRLLLRRDEPEAECTSTLFETKLFVRASTTMHMWSKGMRSCVNQVSLL